MRIITINVNGIRAAERKGFFSWLEKQNADVVCLQEIKAQEDQLDERFYPSDMHTYYHSAERKGYSGTGLYCKSKPDRITYSPWKDINSEGRIIQADFGDLSVISIYLPSGSSKEERQAFKMEFVTERFLPHLRKLQKDGRKYIICGDWNIAHKKIDLKNWRSNQKNSGFLPEERAWLDTLYDEVGYIDSFREINHDEFQYTWWSNRGQAWLNNTGWRLDYQVVSSNLAGLAMACEIYKKERLVKDVGFFVLESVPTIKGQVLKVISELGYTRETNYGALFEVRTEVNPNNLAYTNMGLGSHTDNPYRDPVPTVQLLHCLESSTEGGDSVLVDGFKAATILRQESKEDFAILTSTWVNFRFSDTKTDLRSRVPMIELNDNNEIVKVRYNNRSIDSINLPENKIRPFYKAYRHWSEIIERGDLKITLKLSEGDLILLDNTRIMHARTAFSKKGKRHLQGAYTDLDGLYSLLNVLENRQQNG